MQFMSQSMGWADDIILAMAPLGIITAIVAAIRVGGPSWLKGGCREGERESCGLGSGAHVFYFEGSL